jgi:hypothetical protein
VPREWAPSRYLSIYRAPSLREPLGVCRVTGLSAASGQVRHTIQIYPLAANARPHTERTGRAAWFDRTPRRVESDHFQRWFFVWKYWPDAGASGRPPFFSVRARGHWPDAQVTPGQHLVATMPTPRPLWSEWPDATLESGPASGQVLMLPFLFLSPWPLCPCFPIANHKV